MLSRATDRPRLGGVAIVVTLMFAVGVWINSRSKVGVNPQVDDIDSRSDSLSSTLAHQPDIMQALEPLEPEVLRRRISDVFSSGYQTLIAIIQGVAFGALLTTLQHTVFAGDIHSRLISATQALAVLTAIMVITNQYFLLASIVRWTPTVLDTVVPYALGLGEVGAALALGNSTLWWGSISVLLAASAGSFAYSGLRGTRPVFGEMEALYQSFRESVQAQSVISFLLLLGSLTITLSSIYLHLGWYIYLIAPCALSVGGAVIGIMGARAQNRDYAHYGIPVWRSTS